MRCKIKENKFEIHDIKIYDFFQYQLNKGMFPMNELQNVGCMLLTAKIPKTLNGRAVCTNDVRLMMQFDKEKHYCIFPRSVAGKI